MQWALKTSIKRHNVKLFDSNYFRKFRQIHKLLFHYQQRQKRFEKEETFQWHGLPLPHQFIVCISFWLVFKMNDMLLILFTSQINRKSCCSTRNNSQVVLVTTVLSRGKSCKIDSPNVAPTPKLHSVTGTWKRNNEKIELFFCAFFLWFSFA